MERYKIGQTVRIILEGYRKPVGTLGIVLSKNQDMIVVEFEQGFGVLMIDEIVPVEPEHRKEVTDE